MDADLELLLIDVYCTADDLLPKPPRNAQRRPADAEVLTLCVGQVIMDEPSDRRFLRAARRQLRDLFPYLPTQSGLHKRRVALRETFDWLLGVIAASSPGARDPVVLLDSTPVEARRSLETARRSEMADAAGYGYSRSHSRWFWGFRLHLACSPDGTPRAAMLDDLGARRVNDITHVDLLDHADRLRARGLAPNTVRRAFDPLRVVMRRAVQRGWSGRTRAPFWSSRQAW